MMRNKALIIIISFLLSIMFSNGVSVFAGGIKSRMIARIPVIKALKAKGIIGENNRGYLEFRGGQRENGDVVDAENRDRKTVYKKIAQQQGTAIDVVEKHRAVQIEQKAKPGEWLQDADGKWYRKR